MKMNEHSNLSRIVFGLAAGSALFAVTALTGGCESSLDTASGDTGGIGWLKDYNAALAQAQPTNQLIVMDFYATWCGPCKTMERTTFRDTKVVERMAGFVPLKVDVDKQQQLATQYGIEVMPTTIVADAKGSVVTTAVGYLDARRFLDLLDTAERRVQERSAQ